MLIFATSENLILLRERPEWCADGTFEVCPEISARMYTIPVALPFGIAVRKVYALLPSKERPIYRRLLTVVEDALDDFVPLAIHSDFEVWVLNEQ